MVEEIQQDLVESVKRLHVLEGHLAVLENAMLREECQQGNDVCVEAKTGVGMSHEVDQHRRLVLDASRELALKPGLGLLLVAQLRQEAREMAPAAILHLLLFFLVGLILLSIEIVIIVHLVVLVLSFLLLVDLVEAEAHVEEVA